MQSLPDGSARREVACETLVARYQPVIRSCVRRYRGPRELDDELMQVGYLGLMKAIRNFDPEIGSNLPAYVRPCVSGEIKRYFRDRRWTVRVQRPVQELRLEIREATGPLTQELARAPSRPNWPSACTSARSRSPRPRRRTGRSRPRRWTLR